MEIRAAAAVLLATLLSAPAASPGEAKPEELAAQGAEAWLALLDQGQYERSWDEAATLFKGAVTREKWKEMASGARAPLGKRVSRKLESAVYSETLPGAPDGKYVVLKYTATFENKKQAVETVTPMLDADGAWRVSGYFIR